MMATEKNTVIKIRGCPSNTAALRSQGLGVPMQHFTDKGGLSDADARTIWCKALQTFRNLWCIRMDRGEGVEPVHAFCGQGARRGSVFRDLCGRVLRTTSYSPNLAILKYRIFNNLYLV